MARTRSLAAGAPASFIGLAGRRLWAKRLDAIGRAGVDGPRAGRATLQRHAIELALDHTRSAPPANAVERGAAALAADAVALADSLPKAAAERLVARIRDDLSGDATLAPFFHLLRTAALHRARGFSVRFVGLEEETSFDLLIARQGERAEIVCDAMSAEEGRAVHRGAWFRLMDRIDPDLQRWLAAHPGRYLLKMTLPQGLREELAGEGDILGAMHRRITAMLSESRRAHQDEAVVLRLDPLLLAAARADETGLVSRLRGAFGPEAHLAVTAGGDSLFVLAARAGQGDGIAAAVARRLAETAAPRLSGTRPGILALMIDDLDRASWTRLSGEHEFEGETRRFLIAPAGRSVAAVTCSLRLDLLDELDTEGIRFRNPAHPAARHAALAPALMPG